MTELAERYARVGQALADACRASGRSRESVRLLAVSKFHPVEDMLALVPLGQRIFGENYVQEALEKKAVFEAKGLDGTASLHLIGHVQSRKAHLVAGSVAMIHSLDSEKLAAAMERRLAEAGLQQPVLIEVNLGCEPQKNGVMTQDLERFAEILLGTCPHLSLQGLMCIPPVFDAGEAARPYFVQLRELRDRLEQRLGRTLPELSMGMSGDFAVAVAEGVTIVRVGTAIFGARPLRRPD